MASEITHEPPFCCDQTALQMVFSVRLSICPSVTPFWLSLYHVPIIVSSWNFQELLPWTEVMSVQEVKVRGQRSRSQRSTPNLAVFIRPFEKRDVLCRGNVRPSVCPSVCPSVRVFRTFLQHTLRYQFETWYIHSVGGTTCRVWVASQLSHFDLVYSQK